MSKTLGKNLHFCFSLIKRPHQHPITNPSQNTLNIHQQYYYTPSQSPTSYTKAYNTLFEDLAPNGTTPIITTTTPSDYFTAPASPSSASEDAEMDEAGDPDLTAAYASCRFFISSPGRSNSIVDSLSSIEEENTAAVAGAVPVRTYSPDPYVDFRRSMQEMVESRELAGLGSKEAWVYLQELLLTYLSLNPKSTHKYIVRAFADLVVNVMSTNINNDNNNVVSLSNSSVSSCGGDCSSDNDMVSL